MSWSQQVVLTLLGVIVVPATVSFGILRLYTRS